MHDDIERLQRALADLRLVLVDELRRGWPILVLVYLAVCALAVVLAQSA